MRRDEPFHLCTRIDVDGVTYYHVGGSDVSAPAWSTDPGVGCEASYSCSGCFPGPLGAILETVNSLVADTVGELAHPPACSLLASLSPGVPGYLSITPEGDTYLYGRTGHLVWNCPETS
jgi:hypothetical protein